MWVAVAEVVVCGALPSPKSQVHEVTEPPEEADATNVIELPTSIIPSAGVDVRDSPAGFAGRIVNASEYEFDVLCGPAPYA